jgi:hypothetical protein
MLNRDRYAVVRESEYDGETIEYFPLREFPFPDDLTEISPIALHFNSIKTVPGKCFHNAFLVSTVSDTYEIVFCYYGSDERLTPHAIVKQDGLYFDVSTPTVSDDTKYYRYASISYSEYMAEMRAQFRSDFDPAKHDYFPISIDKDGRFIFVIDD